MPISDLFGLIAKRQTTPDKYLASSVNVVSGGQHGAARAPFNQHQGIRAYRSWVYAAATINANAVASLPLRLYAKSGETPFRTRSVPKARRKYLSGDDSLHPSTSVMRKAVMFGEEFEEVTEAHPITDLLATANPYLNGFDLSVLRILYGELTGNAYLHPVIDEESGYPAELWPLAPQFVEVIPDEDAFLKGYLYGIDSTKKQVFEADEVIHFRRPNPGNLFYGMGKVEAAFGVVQANEAVHEMDLATFSNQARPDYAVVVKGTPTGDQLDRFQQQVENRLRGSRKDGSFITVTGEVQFTPLNFPPKDLAGRDEIVEEIAAVFGVPVTMLKANDPNLASAQTGFAQWREGTILPLCRMDEQELNQTLLPLFGLEETHCLAYDNPVPSDRAFELQQRTAAVAGGWRTPNEARIEEGKEPVDDEMADRLLIGGQPLGGAAAGAGVFGLNEEAEEQKSPLEDRVSDLVKTVESLEDRLVKTLGKVQRMRGEPLSDCVDRGVEVLQAEGYDRDQALAIAFNQCGGSKAGLTAMYRSKNDLYETPEEAAAVAAVLGCEGFHTHEVDGRTMFMPCSEMADYTRLTGDAHASDDDLTLVGEKAIADVDLQPTEQMAELAERGLKLREEHGRGGTMVGVSRARDIKNRVNLTPETVARMANFFSRHRVDLDAPAADPSHEDYPSAGVIAWLLWGGDPANPDEAGAAWSERKLEELDGAREKAEGDRVSATPAKPSERIEGSDENPEGSASGSRGGIEISEATEKALKNKVEKHNEKHGKKKGKKVDLGMLKAVYRRGAGAFSTSHRPGMTRNQWSMARVNAFLYLVRTGRPKDAKYTTDNDLLPEGHPKKSDKKDKGCGCSGTSEKSAKVYDWHDEEKTYRLKIEGLADDFERLHPKNTDEPVDASRDVREGESKTPAMEIATIAEDALAKVRDRLIKALKEGEITPTKKKATKTDIDRIVRSMKGLSDEVVGSLITALQKATAGGSSVGLDRINEILSGRGAGRINTPTELSEAMEKVIRSRAQELAKALIEDTIRNVEAGLDADFTVEAEVEKLIQSHSVSRTRAEMIARTESAKAFHEGQIDTWKQTGIVKRKRFLLAPGACQFCQAVDKMFGEQGDAIPIDQPFVKSGQTIQGTAGGTMSVKMDSQGGVHPNCRCGMTAELDL